MTYTVNERLIQDFFGIPNDILSSSDYVLETNKNDLEGTTEKNFKCDEESYKFALVSRIENKPIFIMDFRYSSSRIDKLRNEPASIRIELIVLLDKSLRKKGIASYYINKLKSYAVLTNRSLIKVHANTNAKNFKNIDKTNSLNQKQLVAYYNKFNDDDIQFIVEEY